MDSLLKSLGTMVTAIAKAQEKRAAGEGSQRKKSYRMGHQCLLSGCTEKPHQQKVKRSYLDPFLKTEPSCGKSQ